MKQFKGYLINSKQAIQFCKWYLANPLHTQFQWMYPNHDTDTIKKVLTKTKHNPKALFFGNQLSQSVATYSTIDHSLTPANKVGDGSRLSNISQTKSITINQYLDYLKKQTLVSYKQIKQMGARIDKQHKAKIKAHVDKQNKDLAPHDRKCNHKLIKYIRMYQNNHSKFSQSAKEFNYKKYLANHVFCVNVSDEFSLKDSVIPLLKKSTQLFPKRAKLNKLLANTFAHVPLKYIDNVIYTKGNFVWTKLHHFVHKRLDIFEITAWVVLHKWDLVQDDNDDILHIPKAPAFKSDLVPKRFYWENKESEFNNTDTYFSDMNMVADYLKLKHHEL